MIGKSIVCASVSIYVPYLLNISGQVISYFPHHYFDFYALVILNTNINLIMYVAMCTASEKDWS